MTRRPFEPASTTSSRSTRSAEHGYIADDRLATTVFLQSPGSTSRCCSRGPPGVGKTELAKALAAATGRRLLRLQCYEGQDETKALYEWDYGKQLLYTQILREKIGQVVADAADLDEAVERIGAQESVFFSERFLAARPLLEAITCDEPVRAADRRGRPRRRGARGGAAGDCSPSSRSRSPRSARSPPSTRRTSC